MLECPESVARSEARKMFIRYKGQLGPDGFIALCIGRETDQRINGAREIIEKIA